MTNEELLDWCCNQNCKLPYSNCDLCMYNRGFMDGVDDTTIRIDVLKKDTRNALINELNSVIHDLYVKCSGNYQMFYNSIKEQLDAERR